MTAQRNVRPVLLVAITALLAVPSLGVGIRNASQYSIDLRLRYHTARLMLAGENPHRLGLNRVLTPRARAVLGENARYFAPDYLPSAMLVMLPLAVLTWEHARLVWLVINLVSAAMLVVVLRRWPDVASIPRYGFLAGVFLWIAGAPFRQNLSVGQNCVFALAFTLGALVCQERKHFLLAGMLLSLGLFKYSYVGLLVLFFFALNHGWKTLLVAGLIHLTAHLMLCFQMGAHPLGVLADVLQNNARIFRRDTMLTLWLPFRTLATHFPQLHVAANLLGAVTFAAMLVGLIVLWRRRHATQPLIGWAFILCLLSTLVVTSFGYHLSYDLLGWIWVLSLPQSPKTHIPSLIVAGCLGYLTFVHRLVVAAANWYKWGADVWMQRVFNGGFFLLCAASLVLFLKTLRDNTPPVCSSHTAM